MEFAIVAPVFLALVFVIAQSALLFLGGLLLDSAVEEAARLVRTGQIQADGNVGDEFRKVTCAKVRLLVDCDEDNFQIAVRTYSDFDEVATSATLKSSADSDKFDMRSSATVDFGGPNDIVVIRATLDWSIGAIYAALSFQDSGTDTRVLSAFKAFRNEPFAPGLGS